MADNKQSFIFYIDWWSMLQEQPDDIRLKIHDAISAYAFEGKEPTDPIVKIAFPFIKGQIDRDIEKYLAKIEKRREAGRAGGVQRAINAGQELKQNQANQANACNAKQNQANQAYNVNDNSNVNSNENNLIEANASLSTGVDAELPIPKKAPEVEMIDFVKLIAYWNGTMKGRAIPCIKDVTPQREAVVNARCKEYGKQAIFATINKAAESDYLNGAGSKGFIASFDWVFRPNNFPKVYEGNYDNRDCSKFRKPDYKHTIEDHGDW